MTHEPPQGQAAISPIPHDLVGQALRQPQRLSALTLSGWEALVRQARRADLLARIGCILQAQGTLEAAPEAPRRHLCAAILLSEAQHGEVHRELQSIREALDPTGVRPVLLKGAAYVACGLLPAMGRLFTDIDIMVPKTRLPEVEAALMAHGWATTHHNAYDQRYYRQWMHELPPLRHLKRQTVLDVHHSILPETARLKPNSDKLLSSARPVEGLPHFAALDPVDMTLHSMVHLFHNEVMARALRDLSDLDLLMRQFGVGRSFWIELLARGRELGVARILYYGLRYTSALLATPVPAEILAMSQADRPSPRMASLMDRLWSHALRPQHETASDRWTPWALRALFVRAHWLRMPPGLLMRHLTVKALQLHARPVEAA